MIKSRKMILYTAVLSSSSTQLHVSQYHPVKKKGQSRPKYSVWCLPQLHNMDVRNQKTNPEFCFTMVLQIFVSIFCCFIPPPPSSFIETTERHDGLYSLISMLLQGVRPPALSSLFRWPTPSFLLGKGSFVWNGSHAVSDARVSPGPTLSSAGFHRSRAAAATAVTVTTTENVIYSKHWNAANSSRGTQLCLHPQGQWLKVKPQTCNAMMKKANLSHPNTSNNHQIWLF